MVLSIGVYKQKMIFFILMMIALVAMGYFISRQFSSASISEVSQTQSGGIYTIDVEISKNAKVKVSGQDIPRLLHLGIDYDEFRYKVYDKDGLYINQMKVVVHLPKPASLGEGNITAYAIHGIESYNQYQQDSQTIVYEANNITPAATYTIVTNIPKGMLEFPLGARFIFFLSNVNAYIWLGVSVIFPIIALLILFWMFRRSISDWHEPKVSKELNQPPDDLPPAELGALIDGKVSSRSIAAIFLDLAKRNYIQIVNRGEDFTFGKRKPIDLSGKPNKDLKDYEVTLLSKVFSPEILKSNREDILFRIGKHIFSRKIANVYLGIYRQVANRGYFIQNPSEMQKKYKTTGLILFFVALLGFIFGIWTAPEPKYLLVFWFAMMFTAGIIIKMSEHMPVRTKKGREELIRWLAFRKFLTNPKPISNQEVGGKLFEEFLPYAITMHVEVEWTKRFINHAFRSPDWYIATHPVVVIEDFVSGIFPIIGFVSGSLAASREPTV